MDRLYHENTPTADEGLDPTLPHPAVIRDLEEKRRRRQEEQRPRLEIEAPALPEHDPEAERAWQEKQKPDDEQNERGVYEIKL